MSKKFLILRCFLIAVTFSAIFSLALFIVSSNISSQDGEEPDPACVLTFNIGGITGTPTPTNTPTPGPTATPTPPENTPTPTSTPGLTTTPTPTSPPGVTSTPTPVAELPEAGIVSPTVLAALGGLVLVILGFLL